MILDEPSTYIDKRFEARLYELLAEINKDCAIILVSHDIGTVLQQVKSIACVNETLDYHPIPAYGRMAGTQLQLPDRVAGARDTAAQDIERTQAFSRMTGSKGGRPIVEPTSRYPSE